MKSKTKRRNLAIIVLVVIILIAATAISPLVKQEIRRPLLQTSAGSGIKPTLTLVESENVNWAVNEIGAYKLNDFLGVAEIEIDVSGDKFSTKIHDHIPSTDVAVNDPDIKISISEESFRELYASTDIVATAKQMVQEGKISVEILESEVVLAGKGYAALYDSLK